MNKNVGWRASVFGGNVNRPKKLMQRVHFEVKKKRLKRLFCNNGGGPLTFFDEKESHQCFRKTG